MDCTRANPVDAHAIDIKDLVVDGNKADVIAMLAAQNLKVRLTFPDSESEGGNPEPQTLYISRKWTAEQVLRVYANTEGYKLFRVEETYNYREKELEPTDLIDTGSPTCDLAIRPVIQQKDSNEIEPVTTTLLAEEPEKVIQDVMVDAISDAFELPTMAMEPLSPQVIAQRVAPPNCCYDDFDVHYTVGFPTFGRVRLAKRKDNPDGEPCALKIISKQQVADAKHVDRIMNEKMIWEKLQFPFISTLHYTFQDDKRLFLVSDCCSGGEVITQIVLRANGLPDEQALMYVAEISFAILYLHSMDIMFRNIRPENILITRLGHIKLADFGVAKILTNNEHTWTICGTPQYLCPEMVTNSGHGMPADSWALGICTYEMCVGIPPINHENLMRLYEAIAHPRTKIAYPKNMKRHPKDFIKKLLQYNASRRIGSSSDIHNHKWFKDLDWQRLYNGEITPPYVPEIADEMDANLFDVYPESNETKGKAMKGDPLFKSF